MIVLNCCNPKQERDSLKSILTSYESEVTINYSTVSQQRIVKLESQLESYKEELQRLEKELDAFNKESEEEKDIPQVKDIVVKRYISGHCVSNNLPKETLKRIIDMFW